MTHPPVAPAAAARGDATSGDAYGGDVAQSQDASNTNSTSQEATAESKAVQVLPVNVAVPVCVAKACDTGSVEQSNTNTSGDASAKNINVTDQSNEQWQQGVGGDATTGDATTGGSGDATTGDAHGGDVTQSQSASNTNDTWQDASATSKAIQVVPVNVAVPVCIAASCKTGDVEQSNENRSGDASAFNGNSTWQSNEQGQSGYGGDASTGDATTGGKGCCSSGDATSGNAYGGDVMQSQSASELEQHVAECVREVEGDPDRAGERRRAGLHRLALRDGWRRAVEHEQRGRRLGREPERHRPVERAVAEGRRRRRDHR